MSYIRSYKGWKILNEAADAAVNKTPTKTYSDVNSGILDLHPDSFDVLSQSKMIPRDDLFKSSSKRYCKEYTSFTNNNLREFITKLLNGESVDRTSAYQKFSNGAWKIPTLSEGGAEMYIFSWIPTDSTFESFKIKIANSGKFGGKVAWTFEDNMWYPVKSGESKGVLNGFGNADRRTVSHNFKSGDIVYVKMNPNSMKSVTADSKAHLEWYSGLQYITKSERNEAEYSSEFSKWKDSVAIDRQRGPNTPAVPGYIVLLEREDTGAVSSSDIDNSGGDRGEEYIGMVV